MNGLPPDLQTLWESTLWADAAAEALAAPLPDEQFFWRPDQGRRWSVALCLDHLAVSNTVYSAAIRSGVEKAKARGWTRREPARPGSLGGKFVQSLEPPVRRRTRAPGKIAPQPARSREAIMRAYREAHDEVRHVIAECVDVDVNRATFRNPFIAVIRFSVATGLNVIAAHDRRHLWQAEKVVETLRETIRA